jgi:hypothetical protein
MHRILKICRVAAQKPAAFCRHSISSEGAQPPRTPPAVSCWACPRCYRQSEKQKYGKLILAVLYVLSWGDYSAGTMAPLGQESLQLPQSRQAEASMT